jgi:uncharacterized membrane protein YfcA
MTPAYRITRRPILLGASVTWAVWLLLMFNGDYWHYFKSDWFMSVTMVFGSFIAGATSEGGGAVAFPVMTLAFDIPPHIARDFSLMIQSVGMMAAAFTIFCLRIPVEWRAVLYAGAGGVIGIIVGIELIAPLLTPAYTKIFFTSTWLAFAVALVWINRNRNRQTNTLIPKFQFMHAILLVMAGLLGGIISGLTGSGLDILIFSLLVLAYRLNEKVATPTSVVLMGMNALAGFVWQEGFSDGMAEIAWHYWYVCVPIVVIGAPAGAAFIRNHSRLFVVGFLIFSISLQYIAALIIIPMTVDMLAFSALVFFSGVVLFGLMAQSGARLLRAMNAK